MPVIPRRKKRAAGSSSDARDIDRLTMEYVKRPVQEEDSTLLPKRAIDYAREDFRKIILPLRASQRRKRQR